MMKSKTEPKKIGLTLLIDTLKTQTANSEALGSVLTAMDAGTLTVNGEPPDKAYPLGEYLIHGGRIKFDLSELNDKQKTDFFNFITNQKAQPRIFATHRASTKLDAAGSPAEEKSSFFGGFSDVFSYALGRGKHFGIDLAIGGLADNGPQENGEWGHMYIHRNDSANLLLIGIEPSAPGMSNARTGEAHSKTGAAGKLSPFLEKKINSQDLRDEQSRAEHAPLSTNAKYNWATVKIDSNQLIVNTLSQAVVPA